MAADAAGEALARTIRSDGGRLLAALIATTGRFQLAEESLQDAIESALVHWRRSGVPASPQAWLMTAARRKAIDRLRRDRTVARHGPELERLLAMDSAADEFEESAIPDERLKLIFTCCHPALERQASVALTLRTLCGLTTEDIARAFVVSRETMAQRLVRAQQKIAKAGIPFRVPEADDLPARIGAALTVIYLIFNQGYSADEPAVRVDLCEEAIRLARLTAALLPGEAEPMGLLALLMLHHARRATRLGEDGAITPLEDQDRSRWDRAAIAEGVALIDGALARKMPGSYQMQAAIAALHAEAASFERTDWRQIALLYGVLEQQESNPVYALNRVAALSQVDGPDHALALLGALAIDLSAYQPFYALRANLLARTGDSAGARAAYSRAAALSVNRAERKFLEGKASALTGQSRSQRLRAENPPR